LDKRITGLYRCPGLEKDLRNAPADFGIDRDLVYGGDRTDAGGETGHRLGRDNGSADLRGRRFVVREIGRDRLFAEPVEAIETTEYDGQQEPDDH